MRIALWFVELFASPREAEGIVGDLVEEFHAAASEIGEAEARRRFRRHALQTICDLAASPWRATTGAAGRAARTLLGIGFGVVALAISWSIAWTINAAALALVVRTPIYSYVPASWFWWATDLSGPMTAGFLVALIARAAGLRPMSVAVAATAAMAVLFAVDVPVTVWLFGLPPRVSITFGFLAYHWIYGVAVIGGTYCLGAMLGRLLPLPSRMRQRA